MNTNTNSTTNAGTQQQSQQPTQTTSVAQTTNVAQSTATTQSSNTPNSSGAQTPNPNINWQKVRMGFRYDGNGNLIGLNGNVFARHILSNFDIVTKDGAVFYMYSDNYWVEVINHELRKILRKFFNSYEKDKWCTTFESIYWSNLSLEAKYTSQMQSGTNYINLVNGLYNLETMALEPHNKDVFTTVQIPIDYNPNAAAPTFNYFLNDVFQKDAELIQLTQEIMGYCLSCSTQAQKMFVLLGEGANGKSLFCNILTALCGEKNVSSVSLRNLGRQFSKANLVDKLLNVSTENEMTGTELNTEDIKAISSGDLVQVERKFENPYSTKLYAKLMFSVNRLPYSRDNTYAIMRRLVILPFLKTYVENQPKGENQGKVDLTLEGRILAELDGIFNFALAGLQRLQANNYVFTKSQKSAAILKEYQLEINPFLDFVQSCIVPAEPNPKQPERKSIEIHELFSGFKEWCYEGNHKKLLDVTLKRFLKEITGPPLQGVVLKD